MPGIFCKQIHHAPPCAVKGFLPQRRRRDAASQDVLGPARGIRMARTTLTGSRIRERRLVLGRRQADLARSVGISPSYLNLIEHNRRRIGGKLVQAIARELRVDVAALTEGAEAALVNTLREAAADHRAASEELPRLEEFVGRFPGLAQLLADTRRRALSLERTVEVLSDRMTHDPFLSDQVHELLSTITAIRSTAAILAETEDIDPEWRTRFHRNIAEESRRLADGGEALVRYLDESARPDLTGSTPQEELDAWLTARAFHMAELERALPPAPETLIARAEDLQSAAARALATRFLARYAQDVALMPLARMRDAVAEHGPDPGAIAARFGVDLAAAFRRLACLPEDVVGGPLGLVACDGSGTLTFRKPVPGFTLPRYSAACPLWPLYQTLSRPMAPVRTLVETVGRRTGRFLAYAICQPADPARFGGPQVLEALMLLVPAELAEAAGGLPGAMQDAAVPVGSSCRICPQADCPARREPSILGGIGEGAGET
jgi:transcriptional regulator with XRE-family HTH domain